MLVIFGANGRTGREILRQALAAGMAVRPVVRDDRDGRGLDKLIDVGEICYADADHPASIVPVLEGATQVVSCINARTAGHGCPEYGEDAGANIVKAAVEADRACTASQCRGCLSLVSQPVESSELSNRSKGSRLERLTLDHVAHQLLYGRGD